MSVALSAGGRFTFGGLHFVNPPYACYACCAKNPFTMLLWGFCIVALVVLGFATYFAGLIITMPIVGHATWHVYRDIVEAEKPPIS